MTNRSGRRTAPVRRTNTMRRPSGDHAGWSSSPFRAVSFVVVEEDGSSVNREGAPSRSERKTSRPFDEGHSVDAALAGASATAATNASERRDRPIARTRTTLGCAPVTLEHPTLRAPWRLTCLVLVALVVVAAGWSGASAADRHQRGSRPTVKTRRIAPGLTYTRIVRRSLPLRTYVLRA